MNAVGEVLDRKERPAYVRFERVPLEDKASSLQAGHYVAKDVDYALITPPYSKDVFKTKVVQWLADLKQQVNQDRLPREWAERYEEDYNRWKNGQEIPLRGSPIKGWGVISPAQQETIIRMNILTVEDLAGINDEGVKRIGMGGIDLKTKASAWLSQLSDKGPLTQEIASVRSENNQLRTQVENLTKQVENMMTQIKLSQINSKETEIQSISASDILIDEAPVDVRAEYEKKFGKPAHHRMKEQTIREQLK